MPEPVVEVVGVYAADGGILGEVAYVVGHLLGRTECGLCDVTHGAVRRKPEWDDMAARLPGVRGVGSDGSHTVLLGPTALGSLGGSVELFEAALLGALATQRTA